MENARGTEESGTGITPRSPRTGTRRANLCQLVPSKSARRARWRHGGGTSGALAFGRALWPAREGRNKESSEIVPVQVVDVQGTASRETEDGRTITTTGTIPTWCDRIHTQGDRFHSNLLYPGR